MDKRDDFQSDRFSRSSLSSNKNKDERKVLLQQLLEQAFKSNNEQQLKSTVAKIVSILMRSRPLCRQFNGTPLTGVYRKIYDLAERQLMSNISQEIAQNSHLFTVNWLESDRLYQMQSQTFKQILNDAQLKELGLTAQRYLPNSELRSYALTELVKAIKLSGKLCRPHSQKFSYEFYQILYEEAVTETFTYICLNIDAYDPERKSKKFMSWVNFYLDKFLLKCYENHLRFQKYHLPTLRDLEQIGQPEPETKFSDILYQYLKQDPQNIFQTTHIRNRPDANFRSIALAKIDCDNWDIVAAKFEIPVSTLSSFYNRWCRRFAPLIKQELNKHI